MCPLKLTFKIFRVRITNILHEFYSIDTLRQERNTEPAVSDVYFLETAVCPGCRVAGKMTWFLVQNTTAAGKMVHGASGPEDKIGGREDETLGRRRWRHWRRVFKDRKGGKEGGAKMLRRRDLCTKRKSLKKEAPGLWHHTSFPEKLQTTSKYLVLFRRMFWHALPCNLL